MSYYGYLMDTCPTVRERLKLLEQREAAGVTLFRLQVPKLWMRENVEGAYQVTRQGDQWRVDSGLARLESQLYK
jgi:hypothetical protein